jgi:hypothetical protein
VAAGNLKPALPAEGRSSDGAPSGTLPGWSESGLLTGRAFASWGRRFSRAWWAWPLGMSPIVPPSCVRALAAWPGARSQGAPPGPNLRPPQAATGSGSPQAETQRESAPRPRSRQPVRGGDFRAHVRTAAAAASLRAAAARSLPSMHIGPRAQEICKQEDHRTAERARWCGLAAAPDSSIGVCQWAHGPGALSTKRRLPAPLQKHQCDLAPASKTGRHKQHSHAQNHKPEHARARALASTPTHTSTHSRTHKHTKTNTHTRARRHTHAQHVRTNAHSNSGSDRQAHAHARG